MAYTKHTWVCGEDITDELLNNLEEGVEEALAKECDCGYSCTEARESLIEESVTTEVQQGGSVAVGEFSTDPFWNDGDSYYPDTIIVTFDGTEYTCLAKTINGLTYYGATVTIDQETDEVLFDWSEYPFNILGGDLSTQTAGTYSVKIEAVTESIETSECFEKAVLKVTDDIFVVGYRDVGGGAAAFLMDKTYDEIREAFVSGKKIIVGNLNGDHYYGTGTVLGIKVYNSQYYVYTSIPDPKIGRDQFAAFYASSADTYPTFNFD